MEFVELTTEEFKSFTDAHFSHFTQTLENYQLKVDEGTETYLVGLKDEGKVRAACLLTLGRVMRFFKVAYTNRGPVMDFNNKAIFNTFLAGLQNFLKGKNVLYLRVDPYIVLNERDHEGNVTKNMNNDYLIDEFSRLGFKHDGFTKGFRSDTQIRWHSILDLRGKTEKEVFNDFDTLRKRNIRRAIKDGIKVRYLGLEDIDIFTKFMEDTSEMKDFFDRGADFYISRKKYFKDKVMIPMAYVNLDEYVESLEKDVNKIEKDIERALKQAEKNPDNKKAQNKVTNLSTQHTNIVKKFDDGKALREEYGKELPLSAAYYINTHHEVDYLAGGTANEFRHFAGSYLIQWEMIQYALQNDVDIYNFYGISGDFTEDAEDYGVIQFKKGFNAKVNEYIGDFVKPMSPVLYSIYKRIKK